MSTTPVLPDPSQQPAITADDPRVAQVLALIKAKAAQAQAPDPINPQITTQISPVPTPTYQAPQQIMPPAVPPVAPQQVPSASDLSAPAPANGPQINPVPVPAYDAPNVAPPASKPGPIKSFLQHLASGLGQATYEGSQAALQHLGLPTDYEKQQTAAKLAIAQQAANDNSAYRQSLTGLTASKAAQLDAGQVPFDIPNDPKYGAFAGVTLPTVAATAIMQRMEALQNAKDIASGKNTTQTDIANAKNAANLAGKNIQYGPDSYLRHGFKSISGRDVEYDKGTGQVIKDYGPSNSVVSGVTVANARAAANARYRTFDTVDGNGNPVTISGLDALEGGAAHTPYSQAKGVQSDKVGIQQYDQILGRISQNLPVINDNNQRIAIAHTLAEADKNPGMLQSIITSGLQSNALTPAGAQLTADIMQGREFGGVARKYGGNMNGTEGLMNRIMANQASPLNSLEVNRDLVANDQAFTKKANTVVSGLTSHNAGNRGGPPNVSPQANATTTPQTHIFSLSAWKAANPSGNTAAAQAAAAAQGYQVVQ
jgi:hypothetical protein